MSEVWAQWEGQVINGEFPLRRCLGVSDHSGVFLTEAPALNLPEAALKLVPLIPTLAESQLAHWNAAAALSHPHLVRLFATGRCQLGTLHCLYVLMEYAEQNLAHLLRNRPLTDLEARDLLPPALDALAFLHSRNQVQGQLRPSNILVVGDQLKLASDTIRPAGEAATSISMVSVYDPPEVRDGSFSTAGDIWALGVTLYEALTRTTPEKPGERSHGVALPPDFPPGSADIVKECLSRRPGDRPNVMSLLAWTRVRPRQASAAPDTAGVAAGLERAARAATQVPQPSALDPILQPVAAGAAFVPAGASSRASAAEAAPTQPGAVGLSQPDAVASSQPGALGSSQPGALGSLQPGPVGSSQPGALGSSQPTTVGSSQPGTVGLSQPGAVGWSQPDTVASSQPGALGSLQPGAVGSSQPGMVGSSHPSSAAAATEPPGRLTIRAVVEREAPQQQPFEKRSFLPVALGAVVVVALGWFGVRHFNQARAPADTGAISADGGPQASTAESTPPAGASAPPAGASTPPAGASAPRTAASSPPVSRPPASASTSTSAPAPAAKHQSSQRAGRGSNNAASSQAADAVSVVHEEMPNVSHNALATVRGRVKVTVRVTIDTSGNVVSDTLENAGPSQYFARAASQAARKWKFAPARGSAAARTGLVRFEFSRSGATGHLVTRS